MVRRRKIRRVGYLLVHGVGNQDKKGGTKSSVLRQMGKGILEPISEAFGPAAVDWKEIAEDRNPVAGKPFGSPAHAKVKISVPNEAEANFLMVEAVWSDRYTRPSWWRVVFSLIRNLPALILLIGPDRRDREVLLDGQIGRGLSGFWMTSLRMAVSPISSSSEMQQIYRFGWRLITLLAWVFGLVALASIHFLALPVLVIILLSFALMRLNVMQPVITATECDSEREALLDYLENRLDWLRDQCDDIVIIAHSQGGYLAHQLLIRNGGRNQEKVIRLVGVGSGLKPIWILRQARKWDFALVMWLIPAASLCLVWGISPILAPGLSATAAGLLGTVSFLEVLFVMPPVAVESSTIHAMTQGMSEMWLHLTYTSAPFSVARMTIAHWGAVVLAVGIALLGAWLAGRRVIPQLRDTLELPAINRRPRPLVWREYSSQHDMVGRMLLPILSQDVEQKAVPVVGHPLRDHTRYFHPQGALVLLLAGSLLEDLEQSTRRNFRADAWNQQVDRYMVALREQHDRRRRFHGLLMLGVGTFLVLPALAAGGNLIQVLMDLWLWFALATVALSISFTLRACRSQRQVVAALYSELRGEPEVGPLVRVISAKNRRRPSFFLFCAALSAYCGGHGFLALGWIYPHGVIAISGFMLVLLAMALGIFSAAVASGYRIRLKWLVQVTALATASFVAPALVASAPNFPGLIVWVTTPGFYVVSTVAIATAIAGVCLVQVDPISFPKKDHSWSK